eukprot:Platyproteum_vivax@DN11996_c0_g1_i1.p1
MTVWKCYPFATPPETRKQLMRPLARLKSEQLPDITPSILQIQDLILYLAKDGMMFYSFLGRGVYSIGSGPGPLDSLHLYVDGPTKDNKVLVTCNGKALKAYSIQDPNENT